MPKYSLSRYAADDLAALFLYGSEAFGYRKAKQFQLHLVATMERLSENPNLGSSAEGDEKVLRRHPLHPYVIFYTPGERAIVIERIIHMARLKGASLSDDFDLP